MQPSIGTGSSIANVAATIRTDWAVRTSRAGTILLSIVVGIQIPDQLDNSGTDHQYVEDGVGTA